eukprot:4559475-Prymnesium_polylepis.1
MRTEHEHDGWQSELDVDEMIEEDLQQQQWREWEEQAQAESATRAADECEGHMHDAAQEATEAGVPEVQGMQGQGQQQGRQTAAATAGLETQHKFPPKGNF